MLNSLDWDSNFFEKKISRFDLDHAKDIDTFYNLFSQFSGDLVYLFSKEKLDIAFNESFFLADKKVIFQKKVLIQEDLSDNNIISSVDVTDDLLELAFLSGNHSRFNLDKNLSSKFKELYQLWLQKSINRELASEVFVYKIDEKEIAFVTIKKNNEVATIGLIAVNSLYHGKNIGSLMMRATEDWCLQNNIHTLEVATQLDNVQACNFYKKNGFSIKQIDYIYHYYKK